jgi:hypothetical protein
VGFCLRAAGVLAVRIWFRWHRRYGVRCAKLFGFWVFALASAHCIRASSVAPVRGGTYFSLPPQRKVGKRKRLTPPASVAIHGPPTSPTFTRQCPCLRALPTLRMNASPTSNAGTWASGGEWFAPPRWQTVCRLSRRINRRSYRVGRLPCRSGVRRAEHLGPTHSLPPGRPWNIWYGTLRRGCVRRVMRWIGALATNANRKVAV